MIIRNGDDDVGAVAVDTFVVVNSGIGVLCLLFISYCYDLLALCYLLLY